MRIHVENLGAVRQADFELGALTIICGKNNTGKTYATYALFGFLFHWQELFQVQIPTATIDSLLTAGAAELDLAPFIAKADTIIRDGCRTYAGQLPQVFAAPGDRFSSTAFSVALEHGELRPRKRYQRRVQSSKVDLFSIVKEEESQRVEITLLVDKEKVQVPRHILSDIIGDSVKDILFGGVFPRPFIASAERTGAAIFRKELNFARNRLFDEMGQTDKNINPIELLTKVYDDYALPVKTNVDFTRQLESVSKQTSFLVKEAPGLLKDFANIIGGDYSVGKNGDLYYLPSGGRAKLSMDESSSAVRSLLDVGFYLRHVVRKRDLLMIDEPELNLHPDNQRRVARLLSRLVNLGVNVFVTTHSDYFIRELNTLIMLSNDKPHLKRIAEREGYRDDELLSAEKVRVYIAERALVLLQGGQRKTKCLTLTPADIDPELGIEAKSFDSTIHAMNQIQEQIVWGGEDN